MKVVPGVPEVEDAEIVREDRNEDEVSCLECVDGEIVECLVSVDNGDVSVPKIREGGSNLDRVEERASEADGMSKGMLIVKVDSNGT